MRKIFFFFLTTLASCGWFGFHSEIFPEETTRINNFDTTIISITPFFEGCFIDNKNSCFGNIAIAFRIDSLNYESIILDTAILSYKNESINLLPDSSVQVKLEDNNGKKYKHINLGKVQIPSAISNDYSTIKYLGTFEKKDSTYVPFGLEVKFFMDKRRTNVITDN